MNDKLQHNEHGEITSRLNVQQIGFSRMLNGGLDAGNAAVEMINYHVGEPNTAFYIQVRNPTIILCTTWLMNAEGFLLNISKRLDDVAGSDEYRLCGGT